MGDSTCAWFGRPPTTAAIVAFGREGYFLLLFLRAHNIDDVTIKTSILD
jgi:hypothetical protein